MKTNIALLLLLAPTLGFAQSVSCKPHGEAHYTKLEIYKPDGSFSVPWYTARLDNQHNQRKIFTVKSTSRGEKLLFISKDGKEEFTLDFGKYKGPGVYHSVQLALNAGSSKEEKASLMCDQVGDLGFVNLCEIENPNLLFFNSIRNRNYDEVDAHMECGVNPNVKDERGCSALLVLGDSKCGVQTNSKITYNPMTSALPIAQLLKKKGAAMESKDPVNAERALHKFAKLGDWDVVDFLLEKGADVDSKDALGMTPLMRAVERNDQFLVQRIIKENPDLSIENNSGKTALVIAKEMGYKHLIPFLREPQQVILIEAQADGTCSPMKIKIKSNEVTKFTLKATDEDMYLMESSSLGLSLMADAESEISQTIVPNRKGRFDFTCGVHHGSLHSTGQIIIE